MSESDFDKARDEESKYYNTSRLDFNCGANWARGWLKKRDEQYYAVLEMKISELEQKLAIANEALERCKETGNVYLANDVAKQALEKTT